MPTAMPNPGPAVQPAAGSGPGNSPRTLVLGLGNPLLTDDSVGLHVLAHLATALAGRPGIELAEEYRGGLHLMERLVGYERVILIDAQCDCAPPGTVRIQPVNAPLRHGHSAHDADLPTALALGRRAGAALPGAEDLRIVAITAADVTTFGEHCTPAVAASIPYAAEAVLSLLADWR